jgi:hypothetical protein
MTLDVRQPAFLLAHDLARLRPRHVDQERNVRFGSGLGARPAVAGSIGAGSFAFRFLLCFDAWVSHARRSLKNHQLSLGHDPGEVLLGLRQQRANTWK